MPPPDSSNRRELAIGLAVATAIVVLRSIVPLSFEQIFDSDQAVYGLMTKHLSEFRAFPLFFYGQNYMLGVESWIAVPFFWLGGPTVAMQRLPLVLLNVAIACAYVWMFVQVGLRPRYALAASLPLIAFAPSVSVDFVAALGSGIEPFGYALLLWLIRDRPLAFGALLAFGTLHREFTFLALPALAAVEIGKRLFWSVPSLAKRAAGFAAVWLLVDVLKRNINMLGPPGGDWVSGSAALGPQTFVKWLSFDWSSYAARLRDVVTWGIPDMLGLQTYTIRTYSAPSQLEAGSQLAAAAFAVAMGVAIVRLLWLARSEAMAPTRDGVRFCAYLAIIAVQNVLVYGLNGGIVIGAPACTPLRDAGAVAAGRGAGRVLPARALDPLGGNGGAGRRPLGGRKRRRQRADASRVRPNPAAAAPSHPHRIPDGQRHPLRSRPLLGRVRRGVPLAGESHRRLDGNRASVGASGGGPA